MACDELNQDRSIKESLYEAAMQIHNIGTRNLPDDELRKGHVGIMRDLTERGGLVGTIEAMTDEDCAAMTWRSR